MITGTQVILLKGDKILIAKRAPFKKLLPNHWNFIGGKVEKENGELLLDGAIREVKEETGLKLEKGSLHPSGYKKAKWSEEADPFHCYSYIADISDLDQEVKLNPEHTEYRFVTLEELKDYDIAGYSYSEIEEMIRRFESTRSFLNTVQDNLLKKSMQAAAKSK